MPVLQPFSMPLDGVHLIEASAGTGKTFSITSLYLRLLLERQLSVEHILVVTFTRAATEELRDRIRGRIRVALGILEGDAAAKEKDPELADWLAGRAADGDARLLRIALASMDSAAVFTIHGFCQRVLTENAFDTGMAFDLEFIENEDELRLAAVEDFWRIFFADESLPSQVVSALLRAHDSPAGLLARISNRLTADLRLLPEPAPLEEQVAEMSAALVRLEAAHRQLKECWEKEGERVTGILRDSPALNRRTYNNSAVEKALAAATEICSAVSPGLDAFEKQELLTSRCIKEKTKAGQSPPVNPFFDAAEHYFDLQEEASASMKTMEVAFLAEARRFVRAHLERAKEDRRQLYFDDLLRRLDAALAGEGGENLAEHLRRQYPFALIDEFQDTDAVQYRIFRAMYGEEAIDHGLCLVGDPKQAIYGFRGGDVYTYLEAARDARQRFSLETNWRSSSRLVDAVNALFLDNPRPFLKADIHYQPVQAANTADDKPLIIDGEAPVPLQFWKLKVTGENAHGKGIKSHDARTLAAEACADHINHLLAPGRSTLGKRPLEASDIAILVRTHRDAVLIQKTLRNRGIHSVTRSQESVFRSEEARALLRLLQTLLDCEDDGLLRYLLADRLLGRDAGEIQTLLRDDDAWEAVRQRFLDYRERWREQGFIQAFQQLFKEEKIARRLLRLPDGQRRLTNLLHLVELLQLASRSRPGMEQLLRWLADEIDQSFQHEEALLRLENDENLVQVVTMHASKGLEYPVVYLPFPWAEGSGYKGQGYKQFPWFFHDEKGRPCLYLGGGEAALEKAAEARFDYESLAERLRLFYVSVTRAAKLCVLTWGRVNNAHNSALAWLLHPGKEDRSAMDGLDEDAIFQRLEELSEKAPGAIEVRDLPQPAPAAAVGGETLGGLRARPFGGSIVRDWRVNSYSGLVRGGAVSADYDAVVDGAGTVSASDEPVQSLPAGARFGLLVHELLGELDFRNFDEQELREWAQRLSWKHGVPDLRTDKGLDAVVDMVSRVLAAELPAAGLRLKDLARDRRVDEMEFHFSTSSISPRKLAGCLQDFPAWQGAADGLGFQAFQGLMHGYIDLVFRHDGRYWLADYKSNRLDDYGPTGLEEAMTVHHYPLQALVYSLALHRHLDWALSDYDPARHFGGVFYLFTRGMRPGSGAGIWFRSLDGALLEALDRCFGGRVAA